MEISLKWVNELVNVETICLEELVEKLTLGGFEVEEIIETQTDEEKQISLDLSATANRSDSLSIQGVSTEIGALLDQPLEDITYVTQTRTWDTILNDFSFHLVENTTCQSFIALTIENLVNLTSPKWLKQKLVHSGLVPENNLQDFQNYIRLETGYPIELYDLEKIFLKSGAPDFSLSLSHTDNMKQVLINNLPIGTAGIIANQRFLCSNETRNILVEGSIFKASTIRYESKKLGLRTPRSARYEKSIKNSNLIDACYRLIALLRIENPELRCKLHTNSQAKPPKVLPIRLSYSKIKDVLGPVSGNGSQFVSPEQVDAYLKRLTFQAEYDSTSELWEVVIPDLRSNDIINEIDLIEEVGRLHGFDRFLTQLPPTMKFGFEDGSYKIQKKITLGFLSMGLTEFIHYSLVNTQNQNTKTVSLINPLVSEYSNLRSSLLPNLIQTLTTNLNQGNLAVEGFEYGHVFTQNSEGIIYEKKMVAGVFGGTKMKSSWATPAKSLTWFEAKGRLEQFFERLALVVSWKPFHFEKRSSILHSSRTSALFLNKTIKLGMFGQINSILAKKANLPTDVYLFELDFELVKKFTTETKMGIVKSYSVYPKVVKDLSFIISDSIKFEKIKKILYLNGSKFLREVTLLDAYVGTMIPKDHTSLCLQLMFQSDEETLKHEQIEKIIRSLKSTLISQFNVVIRE